MSANGWPLALCQVHSEGSPLTAMASGPHRASHHPNSAGGYYRRGGRASPYLLELSHCLLDFVVQLLPSKEEVSVKEDVRSVSLTELLNCV